MDVPNTLSNCLVYTTLSLNSTTLFVNEKPELIAQHELQDLTEVVSSQMGSINSSKTSVGSIPLSLNNTKVALSMYYVKYILPSNDIVTVITVFSDDIPRVLPVNVLETVLGEYKSYTAENRESNIEFKSRFNQIIKVQEAEFNRSALEMTKGELDQVKSVLNDNIEQVLERNERINLLVNKTDRITTLSNSFRSNTVKVKRKMWWQKVKFWAIIILVLAILLFVIFRIFFG
ncbi:CYFA0S15e02718g1_1 [Cyberlindnera fabianii]|uniref:CYFA0S15e02718g1_1 n=1 Tax=Cyberlindnera fabianii TaxID=36022 RepID=A0A061BCV2_CYBFA|nr:CYFA0S15e02718g1_1 [Cyberlindnera fabianii]